MQNNPSDTRRKLRDLLEARSFRIGEITLSTGATSNFYFDCKPVTLSADGAWLVGTAFLDALEALPERPGAVGGLTHGADPIVSSMVALSYARKCPIEGFYVRKEEKRHGTQRRIENPPGPGTKVVIVDDVVTSGGSLLKAVEQARAAGCEVVAALALVDRQEQDGAANVRAEVETYIPLFTRNDFPGAPGASDASRASLASAPARSPGT
jgi:orotate phosphoribosyltransferase